MAGSTEFTISSSSSTFAVGTGDRVNALAFDPWGNLYEADSGGKIYKITPQGAASQFTTYAATGINNPTGLAFDVNGNLYVSGSGNSTGLVVKVSTDGASSSSLYDSGSPANGLTMDLSGNLYVASFGAIYKIAPGGATTTFANDSAIGLAFDANSFLYEVTQYDNSIKKFSADGSSSTTYATGLLQPYDLAIDANGNLFYHSVLTNASYQVGPGDANVSNLSYPLVSPSYHLAIYTAAPEPSRLILCLMAMTAMVLGRRNRTPCSRMA